MLYVQGASGYFCGPSFGAQPTIAAWSLTAAAGVGVGKSGADRRALPELVRRQLLLCGGGPEPVQARCAWAIRGGKALCHCDSRRFGR